MAISKERITLIIAEDLAIATDAQRQRYDQFAIEPQLLPMVNDDRHSHVWVVATNDECAIWYDDVEEGWNCSQLESGVVIEPGFELHPLGVAVMRLGRKCA